MQGTVSPNEGNIQLVKHGYRPTTRLIYKLPAEHPPVIFERLLKPAFASTRIFDGSRQLRDHISLSRELNSIKEHLSCPMTSQDIISVRRISKRLDHLRNLLSVSLPSFNTGNQLR
ncbi:hypothetical protein AMK34_10345 [Amycolatopsis sp. CB00013]|nr:hypothetical protein AMK34_10345 [Amycolatopsis sp. CB00013]